MRILFVLYDNESYIPYFPIGIAYLTAVLERHGHQADIYGQDVHHYSNDHLARQLEEIRYDMVGLSFIGGYWPYRKALEISKIVNGSKNRPFFCIGGHGPAPEPAYFLRKLNADAVCIGEGEETILELAEAITANRSLEKIKGLAWREGEAVHINKSQAPLDKGY